MLERKLKRILNFRIHIQKLPTILQFLLQMNVTMRQRYSMTTQSERNGGIIDVKSVSSPQTNHEQNVTKQHLNHISLCLIKV